MLVNGFPAFCEGCEFAGDVPANTHMRNGSAVFDSNTNSTPVFYIDDELRFSAGIVNARQPEAPINIQEGTNVGKIIRTCNNGDIECSLSQKGFVPVELNPTTKRRVVASYLNALSGIKLLGRIEFIESE